MNRDLFTKIGMYIVVGTWMFCIGVLVGYQLQSFNSGDIVLEKEVNTERKPIHDDF